MRKLFSVMIGAVALIAAAATGYYGNLEVQSYLGRKAIANTGLHSRTLENALKVAKSEDKLVLVDVSAVWCGTCRRLDNEVFANADVKKLIKERFIYSRLEYETFEGESFLRERNVDGVPNIWILGKDGRDIKRLRVTFDPVEFAGQLR